MVLLWNFTLQLATRGARDAAAAANQSSARGWVSTGGTYSVPLTGCRVSRPVRPTPVQAGASVDVMTALSHPRRSVLAALASVSASCWPAGPAPDGALYRRVSRSRITEQLSWA